MLTLALRLCKATTFSYHMAYVSSTAVVWRLLREKCNVLGSGVTSTPTVSFLFLQIQILCFSFFHTV